MTYARKVAYNTIIQVIGRIATTITSLAMASLLNAGLHPDGWGAYVAVTTYTGLFAVLADLGINTLYLREISRYPEKTEDITANFLGFRLVTALVLLGVGPLLASILPVYAGLAQGIMIVSIGQFFLVFNQIFISVFQARLKMDRAMLTDLCGRLLILIGVIWLLKHGSGPGQLNGALWAVAAGNAFNALLSYFFVRKFVKIRFAFIPKDWPALLLRTLPMGALTVLGMIHFKADSVILTLLRSKTEVGIYGNAYKIIEITLTLPGIFVGGLFPAMTQAILHKDPHFHAFMQKAFDLLLFVALPLVMVLGLMAPLIIGILTRANVWESAFALQVLGLAMLPWFIGSLMAFAMLAAEQQRLLSLFELIAVGVNVALNFWLIPIWGFKGAAFTTLLTETFTTICAGYLCYKVIGYLPSWRVLKTGLPTILVIVLLALSLNNALPLRSWIDVYLQANRLLQAGITLLVGGVLTALYLTPFLLFRSLPPVLQERLNALMR